MFILNWIVEEYEAITEEEMEEFDQYVPLDEFRVVEVVGTLTEKQKRLYILATNGQRKVEEMEREVSSLADIDVSPSSESLRRYTLLHERYHLIASLFAAELWDHFGGGIDDGFVVAEGDVVVKVSGFSDTSAHSKRQASIPSPLKGIPPIFFQ